jgi:hypothetical protein
LQIINDKIGLGNILGDNFHDRNDFSRVTKLARSIVLQKTALSPFNLILQQKIGVVGVQLFCKNGVVAIQLFRTSFLPVFKHFFLCIHALRDGKLNSSLRRRLT